MDNYKFSVGQQVWVCGKTLRHSIIVGRWWYDSQGFAGSPMYDVDAGYGEVRSVDESCLREMRDYMTDEYPLCQEGRDKLHKYLAEQKELLHTAKQAVIEARKEIKRIKSLLGEK